MPDPVVLALDEGTTNSKAVLVAPDGTLVAHASAAVPIDHPQPGWVQQDAEAIWRSTCEALAGCLAARPDVVVAAVGISNQRESVLLWDRRSGAPLGPVVTWQCRRTTEACEMLKARGANEDVLARTGLPLDPLFPALKLRWLLDALQRAEPERNLDTVCAGTVDSWLLWKLTGGRAHATDRSNASRTQLLNLTSGEWDPHLCTLFGVPAKILPQVGDSAQRFGETRDVPGLPDGIPCAAAIGDSHAALFGHGAFAPGDAKATFGTGSSVMVAIPAFQVPRQGLTTTVAWSLGGESVYAFEGNILVSASILPWTASLLGLDGDVDALLALAEEVPDTRGTAFVPALVGLGAPHWAPQARGVVSGLSFAADRRHIARAAAESLAWQVADVFAAVRAQSALPLGQIFTDGGPSRSPFLMGLVANALSHPVEAADAPEMSAFGAACLAGLTVGVWSSLDELGRLPRSRTPVAPSWSQERREEATGVWRDALARCLLPEPGRTDSAGAPT